MSDRASNYAEEVDSEDEDRKENSKGFKSLLNKYQRLVTDYHIQGTQTKKSIATLIGKCEALNEQNKKLHKENLMLKRRINDMALRLNSRECFVRETGCMRRCNKKYYEYDENYDLQVPFPSL